MGNRHEARLLLAPKTDSVRENSGDDSLFPGQDGGLFRGPVATAEASAPIAKLDKSQNERRFYIVTLTDSHRASRRSEIRHATACDRLFYILAL